LQFYQSVGLWRKTVVISEHEEDEGLAERPVCGRERTAAMDKVRLYFILWHAQMLCDLLCDRPLIHENSLCCAAGRTAGSDGGVGRFGHRGPVRQHLIPGLRGMWGDCLSNLIFIIIIIVVVFFIVLKY
jgi:hypothetical protein